MAKSLIDKLRKGVRNTILLGAAVASIGLASCKFPGPNPVPNPDPPTNYPPTATLSAYQENHTPEIIVNLDGQDKNGKQDIVNYEVSVKNNETNEIKVYDQNSPFNNTLISVPAVPTNQEYETFTVSGQCRDSQGAIGNAQPVQVLINPSVINGSYTISGTLQDDETHVGKSGMIRAYNGNQLLETVVADPNSGAFSLEVDKNITSVTIKALEGTDLNPTSYVRTVTMPNTQDSSSNIIRVVPYVDINGDGQIGDFSYSYPSGSGTTVVTQTEIGGFIKHIEEIFVGTDNDGPIFKDNIQYVDILSNNTASTKNTNYGSFSSISTIESVLKNISDVISGGNLNPLTGISTAGTVRTGLSIGNDVSPIPYTLTGSRYPLLDNNYWYVIMPDNTLPTSPILVIGETMETKTKLQSGIIDNEISLINPDYANQENISHEGLRALIGTQSENVKTLGPYTVLYPNASVSFSPSIYSLPSDADQAAIKISREETYPTGTLISDFLGTNF